MKKLFLTCAAVVGISAVFAANAFAADPTVNDAGFDKEKGTYSVAADLSNQTGQMTILIIPESIYTSNAEIKDTDIYYIDQTAAGAGIFQNVGILGGTNLKEGTSYIVKIGGENIAESGIIVEKFTVSKSGTKITRLYGDVNGDELVDTDDAIEIICYEIGLDSAFDDGASWRETAGDVNMDEFVDTDDAIEIICYEIGLDSVFDTMDSPSFEYSEE